MLTSALTSRATSARWLPEREHHVDLGTDTFDQAPDFGEIRRRVEGAVYRPDDIHPRLLTGRARLALGNLLQTEFGPQPVQRPIGALPLVLVDGARQEALDVGAFGRHTAADHFRDRAGDDDRRKIGIERLVRPLHRLLGAFLAELLLGKPGDHDGQLMRRQGVGVVQHRRDRQVLATDRAVDDHLQSLDRGECVDRTPITAGTIVIEDQHHAISSAARFLACAASWRL